MKKTRDKENILTEIFFTGLILMQKVLIFFLEIIKIQNYITQSNKEKLEKEKNVKIKKLKNKLKKTRSSNKRIKNGKNKKLNN